MDTSAPQEPSTAPLNMNTAAEAFGNLLSPPEVVEKSAETLEAEALEELRKGKSPEPPPDPELDADPETDETITIKVDGKDVTLTKAELADSYKNGLRQADYTKKTMEAADARKGAEAETAKAQQDRYNYATNLQKMAAQLEGALQQQQNIDWDALIDADPVEFMKQQHLLSQRQAAYRENLNQQQQIRAQFEAENASSQRSFLASQQDELLAKLPDWKDPAKASAEKAALKNYLIEQGFDEANIANISDHKAVLLGRKAMLYDQMMDKARAASKKVQGLPQKIVRPGVGDSPNLDRRSSAMQKLGRTGTVEDAAAVFANFI
jgi:hypothetical protein